MNGFQLCPKCEGTGNKFQSLAGRMPYGEVLDLLNTMPLPYKDKDGNLKLYHKDNKCPVCNGKMIISVLTGLPPE